MATLMITGGKIGAIIGRRRAFSIGCVIYGAGSLTTALAPNLGVLLFGWSLLEGIGAALIMPAIVALVAGNFPPERRSSAYGLIAAAGAIAVAVGPLIGGAVTTFASWRYVFAGEVVIVLVILALARRIHDAPPTGRHRLDFVGSILSVFGLGMAVFGVLRSSEWGWVTPKQDAPQLCGKSLVAWLNEESPEVGGLQNTALNLGASLGTALVGSVLIATLTTLFLQGVLDHPNIPDSLKSQAQVTFGAGVPVPLRYGRAYGS